MSIDGGATLGLIDGISFSLKFNQTLKIHIENIKVSLSYYIVRLNSGIFRIFELSLGTVIPYPGIQPIIGAQIFGIGRSSPLINLLFKNRELKMLQANGLPDDVIVNDAYSKRSSKIDSKTSSNAVYCDNENPVLRHRSKRVTTKRFTKVYESPTASDNEEFAEL